jgi:hypothetical protein
MKPLLLSTLLAAALVLSASSAILTAADKPKSIDFAGWVTAVNPAAKTIEVKGKKIFVFTVSDRVLRGGPRSAL